MAKHPTPSINGQISNQLIQQDPPRFSYRAPAVSPSDFGKVAVLLGGRSAERSVSLESGQAVLEALLSYGIDAHPVDPGRDGMGVVVAGRFDRAFIVLHGPEGEDGTVQGFLQTLGLPYTGSGVLASALAMDKQKSKYLWMSCGVPTLPFHVIDSAPRVLDIAQELGYPLCLKPTNQGSSFGVFRVDAPLQIPEFFAKARSFGEVMIEPWIVGQEFTVAIIAGQTLPVIEIIPTEDFYNYHAKYQSEETKFECPAKLSEQEDRRLRAVALAAYQSLGCSGWGRVDLMRDAEGNVWVLEVNTVPGMTSHSLVPTAARALGVSFPDLVVSILEQTLQKDQLRIPINVEVSGEEVRR